MVKDHFSEINQPDTYMAAASKWSMGGGVLATTFGWLSSSGAAVIIGIGITVLGFWVNFYFQRRRDLRETEQFKMMSARENAEEQRKQELHDLHVASLKAKINESTDLCE